MGCRFITLRRRSRLMVQELPAEPTSVWRRIKLQGFSRLYKTPRILDRKITLRDYQSPIRQIIIAELGYWDPTFLLTNQLKRSAQKLIERYVRRMIIDNNIAGGTDSLHMDALSFAVAMKVNLDLQLSLMANSLYRLFASKIGNRYKNAKSRHIFRYFIDATAAVIIRLQDIILRFQKKRIIFIDSSGF